MDIYFHFFGVDSEECSGWIIRTWICLTFKKWHIVIVSGYATLCSYQKSHCDCNLCFPNDYWTFFMCFLLFNYLFWEGLFIKNVLYILVIIFKFSFLSFKCFYMLWILNNRFCKYFLSVCCLLFILKDILILKKYFSSFKKNFCAFCVTPKKSLPMIRSWRLFFLCLPIKNSYF